MARKHIHLLGAQVARQLGFDPDDVLSIELTPDLAWITTHARGKDGQIIVEAHSHMPTTLKHVRYAYDEESNEDIG